MICGNSALLCREMLEESNGRNWNFTRSMAGRFRQDSSLESARRAKKAQDLQSAQLSERDERDRQNRRQRGGDNASSCPDLTLDETIADAERKTYGTSRPPLTSASLVVPPSRTSRSSPRLSRPVSSLKRTPPAPKAATESPTKSASPRKENRQTANERAVRVYSPRIAVSGDCRPRSPRPVGPTSPRGSRPPRNEMRPPSAARRRTTASEYRHHPLPWPLHDGSFGGQVVSAAAHHGGMSPGEEAGCGATRSRKFPVRPLTRRSGSRNRCSRPASARTAWRDEGVGNPGEPRAVVSHGARDERGWGNTERRAFAGSPGMNGKAPTSTEQPRSPSRGVHQQHPTREVPAAQRARALELQRLASERGELETQLSEVKRLMRAANTGKMCWMAAATGISGDGLPKTQARIVQRRKRKRRPSTAPSTNVARCVPDEYPTTRRGLGAHCRRGGNERSAWAEHSGVEAGYSSAGEIGCSRRDRNGERSRGEVRSRQYVQNTPYEKAAPEKEPVTETLGASSSAGRPASAGCARDCPRRRVLRENMAVAVQRPKSSPRRPATSSHPPTPRHPNEYQRTEVEATTERGRTAEILHSRDSPCLPTADHHTRETRMTPGPTIDGFTAREGKLKGGHWERGGRERGDERGASSLFRVRGNSPRSAWGENDGRASCTRSLARKSADTRRAFPTPVPFRYNCLGNVVEEIDNCYEDDFKVVSARGSYEYVFVPWGHTLVSKRDEGIGKPLPPPEGRRHLNHDGNLSRATDSRNEGATDALSCGSSSDNLRRTGPAVDADNVPGHSDSWSDGQGARSTQGGGASSWREWNRSGESNSVFQVWDKIIHEARGLRNGHVFEHLWIEYGNTGTATSAETHPGGSATAQGGSIVAQGGSVAAQGDIRNVPSSSRGNLSVGKVGSQLSSSRGNLSATRVGSQLSIHHEHKDEKLYSEDVKGQVPVPQSVGGPQVSAPQSEGGSSLYDVLLSDGSNSDETWSMGSVETSETAEALKEREKGGSSAVNRFSGSSSQQRSSPRPRLGDVGGKRKGPALVVSSSDGSSLYNNFSHGSRASSLSQRATVKDLSVPGLPSKREEDLREVVLHGSVRNTAGLTTTGDDGGRWANGQGGASQGTLESEKPQRPVSFVAKPRQRRLGRQRSTGDRGLDKHELMRNLAARNMGHRAASLGRLGIGRGSDNQGSFDRTPLGGRPPHPGSLHNEGLVNNFRLLEQEASEGTGTGSSVGNSGRTVKERNVEEARLIDNAILEGKDARPPVGGKTPIETPIYVNDEGLVRSHIRDIKTVNPIGGEGIVEESTLGDDPSSVRHGKTLVDERPPSGETPASEHSDGRGRGPDTGDESIVDSEAPGGNLLPHKIQHRESPEERTHLEQTTALALGLGAVEDDIRVTDRELGKNSYFDKQTLNDAQHRQTLEGRGNVEIGAGDGGIGPTESLGRQAELDKIGYLDRLSPEHEPYRASIDEGSLDEHGHFLKEVPPVVEGTSVSDQGLTDRTEGSDGRVIADLMLDRKATSVDRVVRELLASMLDVLVVGDTPREEVYDERKLVAETVTVGGERGDSAEGGLRGANENKSKSREAFDEAPLAEKSPSELVGKGLADGRPLNDRRLAENPSAEQPLDSTPNRGGTPEELVAGNAEVDQRSTHHELPVKLLAAATSQPNESEDINVGETISSAGGLDGVIKDGKLEFDAPLDELELLDTENKTSRVPYRQGLFDGKTLLAGQLPNERSDVGGTQTQSQGGGDSFDGHSAEGRSSGSTHESAETKQSQPDGGGSLDEYLFDGESSGDHSLDGNSFDGQSLSDDDSGNESSFGGSSLGTGSADDLSATDDDLLFGDT